MGVSIIMSRRCLLRYITCVVYSSSWDIFDKLERKSNRWFYSWLNIKRNTICREREDNSRVRYSVLLSACPMKNEYKIQFIVFYCWFTCSLMVFFTIAILIFQISISTFHAAWFSTSSIFISHDFHKQKHWKILRCTHQAIKKKTHQEPTETMQKNNSISIRFAKHK